MRHGHLVAHFPQIVLSPSRALVCRTSSPGADRFFGPDLRQLGKIKPELPWPCVGVRSLESVEHHHSTPKEGCQEAKALGKRTTSALIGFSGVKSC